MDLFGECSTWTRKSMKECETLVRFPLLSTIVSRHMFSVRERQDMVPRQPVYFHFQKKRAKKNPDRSCWEVRTVYSDYIRQGRTTRRVQMNSLYKCQCWQIAFVSDEWNTSGCAVTEKPSIIIDYIPVTARPRKSFILSTSPVLRWSTHCSRLSDRASTKLLR